MYAAVASCKDIALTWGPVTNWDPHSVTRGGYCYSVLLREAGLARNSVTCQPFVTLGRYDTR
jgi:hypothetical protein